MSSISAADTATTAPDGALAPIALYPGEGEHFWFFGGLTTIKADGAGTGGRMMLTDMESMLRAAADHGLEILGRPAIPA